MKSSTIRPGLLVSLKTSIKGNVQYDRRDIEPDHETADGQRKARWETVRVIEDPIEHERAVKVRQQARATIEGVCIRSEFGLLCPEDKEQVLELAITRARLLAQEFNNEARRTEIGVYVLTGRVAQDDVEAARAIGSEVRDLIAAMTQAINLADPKAIRESASKAKKLAGMLDVNVGEKVNAAVAQARAAASEIAKRVEKGGELAATVVAECKIDQLEAARFAFLDMDEAAPVGAAKAAPRAVQLDDAGDVKPANGGPGRKVEGV